MVRILVSSTLAFVLLVGLSANATADVILSLSSDASATGALNILANGDVTGRALSDTMGAASGITVTRAATAASTFGSSTAGLAGAATISGDAAAAGFTYAMGSSYHAVSQNAVVTYTFSGLDPLLGYNFTVFGARNNGGPVGNTGHTSTYTLTGGASGSVEASFNVSQVVNLCSLAGASSLDLTYTGGALASSFGYINAVRISSVAVPEPSAIALIVVGGLGLIAGRRRKLAA